MVDEPLSCGGCEGASHPRQSGIDRQRRKRWMAYIITRLCRDCVDTGCVAVCPVDCIYRYQGSDTAKFPNQLYIHPDECIDCGACEPECPWQAIYEEEAVPAPFQDDTKLNYAIMEIMGDFKVSP